MSIMPQLLLSASMLADQGSITVKSCDLEWSKQSETVYVETFCTDPNDLQELMQTFCERLQIVSILPINHEVADDEDGVDVYYSDFSIVLDM